MSWFFRRGAVLLERLITSAGNVRRNPVTNFSAEEFKIAFLMTNHNDFDLYKASVNRPVIVMKYKAVESPQEADTSNEAVENSSGNATESRACSSKAGERSTEEWVHNLDNMPHVEQCA
ncbi:hypothetical protein Pint_19848 [Pistacia integerrima]|uniref:Uncharacterized protein n=1 Tax=Pistacia integerrima TaxID=434235 RepID=A0ACC0X7P7_9ROSI|nr:hypothetical protein Pint_19848 [Pistacia integerrima]